MQNNWRSRNLVLAGNFNMTNVDELFNDLIDLGQHPKEKADTVTILEKIGHFLDEENQRVFKKYKQKNLISKKFQKNRIRDFINRNIKKVSKTLGWGICNLWYHGPW